MDHLSLKNPVFATYAIAATIMILKAISMSWLTVPRMTQERGGFRSPEDIKKTILNPEPSPKQLEPNERVERIRRILLNDVENLPFFLVAGLLFCADGAIVAVGSFINVRLRRVAAVALRRLLYGANSRYARCLLDHRLNDPDFHDRLDARRRVGFVTCYGSECFPLKSIFTRPIN
jgi:MAPEG family